jgi:hypothetical protein
MFEVKVMEIDTLEVNESLVVESWKQVQAIAKGYETDPFYTVLVEQI